MRQHAVVHDVIGDRTGAQPGDGCAEPGVGVGAHPRPAEVVLREEVVTVEDQGVAELDEEVAAPRFVDLAGQRAFGELHRGDDLVLAREQDGALQEARAVGGGVEEALVPPPCRGVVDRVILRGLRVQGATLLRTQTGVPTQPMGRVGDARELPAHDHAAVLQQIVDVDAVGAGSLAQPVDSVDGPDREQIEKRRQARIAGTVVRRTSVRARPDDAQRQGQRLFAGDLGGVRRRAVRMPGSPAVNSATTCSTARDAPGPST